jgi:hypothetical protein
MKSLFSVFFLFAAICVPGQSQPCQLQKTSLHRKPLRHVIATMEIPDECSLKDLRSENHPFGSNVDMGIIFNKEVYIHIEEITNDSIKKALRMAYDTEVSKVKSNSYALIEQTDKSLFYLYQKNQKTCYAYYSFRNPYGWPYIIHWEGDITCKEDAVYLKKMIDSLHFEGADQKF